MGASRKRVLIVDDQFLVSEYLRIWVEAFGHQVCGVARTAEAACDLARTKRPDVILMDMRLDGERDGVDAALEIARTQNIRIIYVTASTEASAIHRINLDHPFRILSKPVEPAELQDALIA